MRSSLRRLVVTGGTGFVGTPLVAGLAGAEGTEVIVITRKDLEDGGGVRYVKADLSDPASVASAAEKIGLFDGLVALASLIPQPADNDPDAGEYLKQNVGSAVAMLPLLENCAGPVVYVSTLDVYGAIRTLPVTESHPTDPVTVYGHTKLMGERVMAGFCGLLKRPLSVLRLSQVYGPGEPIIKAIPSFIREVADGRAPVLYGDGSDLRDYVYVDDAASAIIHALDRAAEGVYNIAGGRAVSIREVLDLIIGLSGADMEPRIEPSSRAGMDIYFDITRAVEGLAWAPAVSLEEGLGREYDYFAGVGGDRR